VGEVAIGVVQDPLISRPQKTAGDGDGGDGRSAHGLGCGLGWGVAL